MTNFNKKKPSKRSNFQLANYNYIKFYFKNQQQNGTFHPIFD